jgi:hypothetical protein
MSDLTVAPEHPATPPVADAPVISDEERARLAELRAKEPSPILDMRTPEEEAELAKLALAEKAAADAPKPVVPVPTPRERLDALKAKKPNPASVVDPGVRTESEEIEFRVLSEQIAEADRLKELRAMTARTADQEEELHRLDRPEINALVI